METDYIFDFFRLFHGGTDENFRLQIGQIPQNVAVVLGWRCDQVYVSQRDAQKIRFHPTHGMEYKIAYRVLSQIVTRGDMYLENERREGKRLVIVLHCDSRRKGYYMVCAIDSQHRGIFLRTVHYRGNLSQTKLIRRCKPLLIRSGVWEEGAQKIA